MKAFLLGNEILALAARDAGAKFMSGYPITPTTEVLSTWIKLAKENKDFHYLQAEDECAAGFAMIGAILGGMKAFTATAGPGHILMQDALVMAEAMRIPVVCFIGQRGGPSTGTVIYSQQEVNLAIFGGNGEGFRIVYSTSSLQDLYDYTLKAFNTAWQYRFPTIVLYDGYQGKTMGRVDLRETNQPVNSEMLLVDNFRNTYNLEEELNEVLQKYKKDFKEMAPQVAEYENIDANDQEILVIAHGIVFQAVKEAVLNLRQKGKKIGYFRPITLWPFPQKELEGICQKARKIIVMESSFGQLSRLVKSQINFPVQEVLKPALGFTPQEVEDILKNE